jgi:hypothetical protein
MTSELTPIQYNFSHQWHLKINMLRKDYVLQYHFEDLYRTCGDIAKIMAEPGTEQSLLEAKQFLKKAKLSIYDLNWLRKTFDEVSLIELNYAIARLICPSKKLIFVGEETEFPVVTDEKRTIVFDMVKFDRFSGAGSLAIARDKDFKAPRYALEEAHMFYENKLSKSQETLADVQKLIEKHPSTKL